MGKGHNELAERFEYGQRLEVIPSPTGMRVFGYAEEWHDDGSITPTLYELEVLAIAMICPWYSEQAPRGRIDSRDSGFLSNTNFRVNPASPEFKEVWFLCRGEEEEDSIYPWYELGDTVFFTRGQAIKGFEDSVREQKRKADRVAKEGSGADDASA